MGQVNKKNQQPKLHKEHIHNREIKQQNYCEQSKEQQTRAQ